MSAPATQPATTSATPWTLVRLRWALTTAALKPSPWQIVAYVLAYLLAAGTVVGKAYSPSPWATAWRTTYGRTCR